LKSTDIGVIDH